MPLTDLRERLAVVPQDLRNWVSPGNLARQWNIYGSFLGPFINVLYHIDR